MKEYYHYALGSTSEIPETPLEEEKLQELRELVNGGEKLPLAVEEFLSVGGKRNSLAFDFGRGIIETQIEARENLNKSSINIERPFFVFKQHGGCEAFRFVYLDEGEDPMTYVATPMMDDEEIIEVEDTFSEFTNFQLDNLLSGRTMY